MVHTKLCTGRFVIMRRIITTNQPHRIVYTHYMRVPAEQAAQSHDIVNDTMRLAVRHQDIVPDLGYTRRRVYALPAMSSNRVYPALESKVKSIMHYMQCVWICGVFFMGSVAFLKMQHGLDMVFFSGILA